MIEARSKLDEILSIEDSQARINQLLDCARRLKVNTLKARQDNGEYSENQLAVLIYNAEQAKKDNRNSNFAFLVIAVFIMIIVMAGTFIVYYMVTSAAKSNQEDNAVVSAKNL